MCTFLLATTVVAALSLQQQPPPPQQTAKDAKTTSSESAGLEKIGGAVSPPKLISQVEPTFTKAERKDKLQGIVKVYCVVDDHGLPTHVHVVDNELPDWLGQKAVDAVSKYRFQPAMKDGKPVPVELYIDVTFSIH